MARIRTEDIPDPSDFVPNLPAPLRMFIMTSCNRNQEERYPNAARAMEALSGLANPDHGKRKMSHTKRMTPIYLIHSEAHQQSLIRLLEAFGEDARELGIDLRIGDTQEV